MKASRNPLQKSITNVTPQFQLDHDIVAEILSLKGNPVPPPFRGNAQPESFAQPPHIIRAESLAQKEQCFDRKPGTQQGQIQENLQ